MTRLLACLAVLAVPLSGCGIKGDLDRPPPLWGSATTAEIPDENTAAQSIDDADDPIDEPDPFFEDQDEEDVGYGIELTD
ncbi:MAG: lipoprotein [Litorimonas sp.]